MENEINGLYSNPETMPKPAEISRWSSLTMEKMPALPKKATIDRWESHEDLLEITSAK
jgi:hypothetical protein